jgi:hypothetical protein
MPNTTTKAPSPSKQDARVSIRERWAERNEGRHTTCPQPHEQLLVGWNAGGMMTTTTT